MDGLSGFYRCIRHAQALFPGIVRGHDGPAQGGAAAGAALGVMVLGWLVANAATFFCGVALAYYVGGASIEYAGIDPASFSADAIKIGIAILDGDHHPGPQKPARFYGSNPVRTMVDRVRGGASSRSNSDKDADGGVRDVQHSQ